MCIAMACPGRAEGHSKVVESFLRDWHLPGKSELPMKATKRHLHTCTHTHIHTHRGLVGASARA